MRVKVLLILTAAVVVSADAGLAAPLIPQASAARMGLKRAWFAQVAAGQSTGPISYMTLDGGKLLVQTRRNLLSAVDAETGRIQWSTQVGPPNHLSTEPAANEKYVAVVNGSVLYVIECDNGSIYWQRTLDGSPGAGPALSDTHVFVPMLDGRIEGHDLEKRGKQTPWNYKSSGRMLVPPITAYDGLAWTTERGHLYVADSETLLIRYRLETRDTIHSRPAYWTPRIFVCSTDGNVYAIEDSRGKIDWKRTVADAIYEPPVAVEDKVFVVSQFNGMACFDAKQGTRLWSAPRIKQFLATSPTRVYARDSTWQLAVLDAASGVRLGSLALESGGLQLINAQSDRIYLATDRGVIQCLHEAALSSPILYTPPAPQEKETKKITGPGQDAADPAAEEAMPAADAEAPAMEEKKPEAAAGDEEDPFK